MDVEPWDVYRKLAARQPVVHSSAHHCYFVMSYEHVRSAFASSAFTVEHPFRISRRAFRTTMLDSDGDLHDRARDALFDSFRPTRVAEYGTQVVAPAVAALFDRIDRTAPLDLESTIARALPLTVVGALLGLTAAEAAELDPHVRVLAGQVDHGRVPHERLVTSRRHIEDTAAELLARCSGRPDAPVGHALAVAVADSRLSMGDAIGTVTLLFVAGTATTEGAIGNTLSVALGRRDVWDAVVRGVQDPSVVVREALRLEPPLRFTPRFVRHEIDLGGTTLPAGAVVQLCIPSANRDESVYPRPDVFDPQRNVAPALTFGRGSHSCIGAALGQLEAELVLRELAARMPHARLASDPSRVPGWSFRRVANLLISTT